ncbi:MAG TPA: xanthine dehydrogenase family protein subunit M [Caldithrix abyssi]|uniref:Xanthine dehydrogenase family protein subunit M n=1 Tax=Caldithrix abyssi TaxID=187145 RepID=A0A7V4WTW2_CALAY|nr:xanthine dehydrogenase family protein subunit M [Caldithrix abyssi]
MNQQFEYINPQSLDEAVKLAGQGSVYAGGTDLLGLMKNDIAHPQRLVNLKALPELKAVERQKGKGLRLGALVTLNELAENEMLQKDFPAISQAAGSAASPQLRNVGTLGGNLCQRPRCWYFRGDFDCLRKGGATCFAMDGENKYHCVVGGDGCYIVHPSDMAVALLALEAKLEIYGPGGQRLLPISHFYVLPEDDPTVETVLQPGEIITSVIVPEQPVGSRSVFVKFRERSAWDFAVVSVAAALQVQNGAISGGKIALGGVAPVPWLDKKLNNTLAGTALDENGINKIAASALTDAEPLEQNGYKVILARNMIKGVLQSLAG